MLSPDGLPKVDDHERMSKYAALVTSARKPKVLVGIPRSMAEMFKVDPLACIERPCVLCGALTFMTQTVVERVENAGLPTAIVCYPCATAVGLMARKNVPNWQARDAVAAGADPAAASRVVEHHRKET